MRLSAKILLLTAFCGLASCGFPGNKLTKEERLADMSWAFTIFEHNYAPNQLKKDTLGVDLATVKADCMTQAEEDMANDEFIALFQRCIHSVRDAHVSAAQMNNGMLPEFAKIAHLGVVTARAKVEIDGTKTDVVRVLGQFPGSVSPQYPLQAGDLIVAADGRAIADVMKSDLIPYINVGQDESDMSIAGFRFAIRVSIEQAIPTADDITLTVLRAGETFDVTLPWNKEDLVAFSEKQERAKQQPAEPQPGEGEEPQAKAIAFSNGMAETVFGYDVLTKLFERFESPVKAAGSRVMAILENSFRMARFNPIMNMLFNGELGAEIPERLVSRNLGESTKTVEPILPDQMIPAAIVTDESGAKFAYIQIASFPGDDLFVDEFNRLIAKVNQDQIKGLVLDLIDNGGGSLIHGMRMANSLRKGGIVTPSMQVQLNNNWVNAFRAQAHFGATEAEKTLAKRILTTLEEDMAAGLALSRPFSVEALDPFGLMPSNKVQCEQTGKCLLDGAKIAVVVNEFCVSMCDIFADTMQDNDLAMVIGQKTMGGGGNVSAHALSPVSKMMLNLTESLIVSAKGKKYIENNGVEPDLYVDMVTDRDSNFQTSMDMAYRYVTGQLVPAPAPVPSGN